MKITDSELGTFESLDLYVKEIQKRASQQGYFHAMADLLGFFRDAPKTEFLISQFGHWTWDGVDALDKLAILTHIPSLQENPTGGG